MVIASPDITRVAHLSLHYTLLLCYSCTCIIAVVDQFFSSSYSILQRAHTAHWVAISQTLHGAVSFTNSGITLSTATEAAARLERCKSLMAVVTARQPPLHYSGNSAGNVSFTLL
jgi:hypothetical protein